MRNVPKLSVLMPVRNGAAYVAAACASVLTQDAAAFEVIVIDDGSDDDTPAILSRIVASDPRMRVIRQPATGLVASLNRGLHAACAPLIARMDADDLSMPGRFAQQSAYLEANPKTAVLGTGWQRIDAAGVTNGRVIPPESALAVREALIQRNCLAHSSVMMRRDLALRLGGYRQALTGAEDYDLWARMSQHGDVENLPHALIKLREHQDQGTRRRMEQRILAEIGANWLHRCRLVGPEPAFDAQGALDRSVLTGIGMTAADLSAGIIGRALGAAIDARRGGDAAAVQMAVALVLAERPRLRTRLHALLLTLGAKAGRAGGGR